jgi:class 3 adenylate cyclase
MPSDESLVAMNCWACGFHNPDGFRFCGECGAELRGVGAKGSRPINPLSYTPKHLAEKILQSKSALEGERKQVTVLFADVKGSMELAEQVDPEHWHGIMDRFFTILSSGVHRFEGTINQYTGDGIMALFGAPIAHEDHAQRACHAALTLREDLRRFAQELRRESQIAFSVRIGLNSGEVVVGKIGEDLRMDYTAQGHTVGLAARMEQLAEGGTVCLTEHTAKLVAGMFDLEDLGEIRLKGVRQPTRAFALRSASRLQARIDVSRARGFSRFVGRTDEIAALEAALSRAIDGHGQVVGVVGEAGVGKSRLCLEAIERCRAQRIAVAAGRCVPHGRSVPLIPIRELLRSSLDLSNDDKPESGRRNISRHLQRLSPALAEAMPLVFELLGIADPRRPAPEIDAASRQARLVDFLRRYVQARSAKEPIVLFIDDVHWIDAESNALLAELVDALGWTRTLLLVNFRTDYRADWMNVSYYRQLPLRPLDRDQTRELLNDLLGGDPSVGGLAELVATRTQGNPFFIEEIVRSFLDQGVLSRETDHADAAHARRPASEPKRPLLRLRKPVDESFIPATVQALLAARMDSLPEREKLALQVAAVIGEKFSDLVLGHVLAAEASAGTPFAITPGSIEVGANSDSPPLRLGSELAVSLEVLQRADFIRRDADRPGAEYAFNHPLTHGVAYNSQLLDTRTRLHAAVARALQAVYEDRLGERAELIAHHWQAAGQPYEATRWRRRAALKVTNIQLRRGGGPRI